MPTTPQRPTRPQTVTDEGWIAYVREVLPKGSLLSPRVWNRRHRAIVNVALVQSLAVLAFGIYRHVGVLHACGEASVVASIAFWARVSTARPAVRSAYATLSLLTASAMFVHQAGGVTEWHFHFFVMVGLITLYQDWVPFIVAIVFVLLHHGVMGAVDPKGVFGTEAAIHAPWKWAMFHAAFVVAAAAVHVAAWRLSEEQGATDPLTGLPNRLGFTDLVDHLTLRRDDAAVLFIDLDGFKRINDGLGHDAGDEVLSRTGARLREVLRSGDHAARLGGDEFAVVLAGVVPAEAERVAGRILVLLSQPIELPAHDREVQLRASVGVAMAEHGVDGVELVRRADIAMYSAKGHGGARWAMFEPELEQLHHERAEFANDLRMAVQHGQLRLVYQPVIDIATDHVDGVEALLRWTHPVHGAVPPLRFIPIAEESGLIVEIGEWVLDAALAQLAAWTADGLHDLSMAVNVSTRQLDEPGFGDRVLARLALHRIEPHRLVLELTESVLVVDLEQMAARLDQLRASGVRVAIDDFGTGYSSMSYLSRLPVDVVKIDQSFVQRLSTSTTEAALVRSIIELASSLDLAIVAEGVEEEAQAAVLRRLNCTTGQGYLWSKPVEADEIPAIVDGRHEPASTTVAAGT
ncbi:MAG: diguanylate cyclase/phosphodiesterase [Ilumatobacteraceae bacterium]|nr:diguanylate cyclase/phosphodiesterase [Ilumatobacteraceae bacterium]